MQVNLVQLASDALDSVYASAAEDGLGTFVMFWNNSVGDVQYLSLDEFEGQKQLFAEQGVVQEGSIFKKSNRGFVEYILFDRMSEQPHHLALALTATVIKRNLLYVVCYPDVSKEEQDELQRKFDEQEHLLAEHQAEVEAELQGVDVVFFMD